MVWHGAAFRHHRMSFLGCIFSCSRKTNGARHAEKNPCKEFNQLLWTRAWRVLWVGCFTHFFHHCLCISGPLSQKYCCEIGMVCGMLLMLAWSNSRINSSLKKGTKAFFKPVLWLACTWQRHFPENLFLDPSTVFKFAHVLHFVRIRTSGWFFLGNQSRFPKMRQKPDSNFENRITSKTATRPGPILWNKCKSCCQILSRTVSGLFSPPESFYTNWNHVNFSAYIPFLPRLCWVLLRFPTRLVQVSVYPGIQSARKRQLRSKIQRGAADMFYRRKRSGIL